MNVDSSPLFLYQNRVPFHYYLLLATGAASLTAGPSIMLLPVPILAACISITVSAVVLVRKAIKSHPRLIKKINEILPIETNLSLLNDENNETSSIVGESETRVLIVKKSYSLRNIFLKQDDGSSSEQLPLLDSTRIKIPSLGDILENDSRLSHVTISTEISEENSSIETYIEDGSDRASLSETVKFPHRYESYESKHSVDSRVKGQVPRHQVSKSKEFSVLQGSQNTEITSKSEKNNESHDNQETRIDDNVIFSEEESEDEEAESNSESEFVAKSVMDEILDIVVENPSQESDKLLPEKYEKYRLPPLSIEESVNEKLHTEDGDSESDTESTQDSTNSQSVVDFAHIATDTDDSVSINDEYSKKYEIKETISRKVRYEPTVGTHTIHDTLLNMNQNEEEIEEMLLEGSAGHRERLHREDSVYLEQTCTSTTHSVRGGEHKGETEEEMSEIPLDTVADRSDEEKLSEMSISRHTTRSPATPAPSENGFSDGIKTPERTVTLEYFLTPKPRPFLPSERLDKYKLPPASASVDGHSRREPSAMDRMYGRSFAVPTLDFEPELYSPRRRRNRRSIPRPNAASRTRSLEASPDEISRRTRLTRTPPPILPPPNALSARLMPLPSLLDEEDSDEKEKEGKEEEKIREQGSPTRSADGTLEPLLLREAEVEEKVVPIRRNSIARQKSVFSEIAQKRKYFERRAKSFGRRAGILRRGPPKPDS